jgi:hypothetical protein
VVLAPTRRTNRKEGVNKNQFTFDLAGDAEYGHDRVLIIEMK